MTFLYFQPVFVEPIDVQRGYRITRSQSCPELTLFSYKSPIARRKRACSEVLFNSETDDDTEHIDFKALPIQSRHSESNLLRIDKEKTFMQQQNSIDNTGDLLAKVVFALNSLHQTIENTPPIPPIAGKHIFSDDNIREDEEWPNIANDSVAQKKLRSRARSLHPHFFTIYNSTVTNSPQFTWAGNNNDIQNYINAQVKNGKKSPSSSKEAEGVFINIDKPKDELNDETATAMRRKSIFSVFNSVFRRRHTSVNSESLDEHIKPARVPAAKKQSLAVETKNLPSKTDALQKPDYIRRSSILSEESTSTCSEQVLENTTIADLIRAIENVHVKTFMEPKSFDSRRISLCSVQSSTRRGSSAIPTLLDTPSAADRSRCFNSQRLSVALPHNHSAMTMRQNSSPHRFSVSPVNDSGSTSSLSPIVQRRLRQFSTVSTTTMIPQHKLNSSLAARRTQPFKPAISPLALQPPTQSTPSEIP